MYEIHYTKTFRTKIEKYQNKETVISKLDNLRYSTRLESLKTIDPYPRGLFVLKFIKAINCRIIIESKKVETPTELITVLFIREFIPKKGFDFAWGTIIHPQLTSGTWLTENPLPDDEVQDFKTKYNDRAQTQLPPKTQTPDSIRHWLNEFRIKLNFDVYELEDWVLYSSNKNSTEGLQDKYSLLFKTALKSVVYQETNDAIKITLLDEQKHLKKAVFLTFNIGIIYSEFNVVEGRRIIVIHDGAHIRDQKNRWENAIIKALSNSQLSSPSIDSISKLAHRAYPKWILNNENELWLAVQRFDGSNNLSLLPEQVDYLKDFKFPSYINGQAGSGKSTMLYYLFANVCFYKLFNSIQGEILFLTDNIHLLESSSKAVIGLLNSNPEYTTDFKLEDINQVRNYFSSIQTFLMDLLPEEEKSQFHPTKYLSFSKFKELYIKNSTINKRHSPEESWFAISTYVYGYYENIEIDSVEKYTNDTTGIPSKFRIFKPEEFHSIISNSLHFFKKLIEEGYWDKTKLVRTIRKYYPVKLPKQYEVVFCDEAQDFTRIELRIIIQSSMFTEFDLTHEEQFPVVFAGDVLQTVNPTGFSETRLHQMFYETFKETGFKYNKTRSTYNPEYNYRSSKDIIRLANIVQSFRKFYLNEESARKQSSKRNKQSAKIPVLHYKEWLQEKNNLELFRAKFKYKSFIIPIDIDEEYHYINEEKLLDDLHFTDIKSSIDAKGAEYSQVVVYGFGDKYLLDFGELDTTNSIQDFRKRFFFNKLYVAITRAQNELIIIDSQKAAETFWLPLLKHKTTEESWENYFELDEILPFNPETGLVNALESTPEDALANAILDMEQGKIDSNSSRLVVAANVFLMLGKIDEANYCYGLKEEIKRNFILAGSYFEKAGKWEEAAQVYFVSRNWNQLKSIAKYQSGNKQESRILLANLISAGIWNKEEIERAHSLRLVIQDAIRDIEWYNTLSSAFINLNVGSTEEKRMLASIMEACVTEFDHQLWLKIGKLYYDTRNFVGAIRSWEVAQNLGVQNEHNIEYIKARIEISTTELDTNSSTLWKGRLLYENIPISERLHLSKEIIEETEHHNIIFENYEESQELIEHIYLASMFKGNYELMLSYGKRVEAESQKSSILNCYLTFLRYSNDELLAIYAKERWAKNMWSLLRFNYLTVEDRITELNKEFKNFQFKFSESNSDWSIEEIDRIPDEPQIFTSEPPNHFSTVKIDNFRSFKSFELKHLSLINLIVGGNNSGKTSLLEALMFTQDADQFAKHLIYCFKSRKNFSESTGKFIDIFDSFVSKNATSKELRYTLMKGRRSWVYEVRKPTQSELLKYTAREDVGVEDFIIVKDRVSKIQFSSNLQHLWTNRDTSIPITLYPIVPFGKGYSEFLTSVYYDNIGAVSSVRNAFIKHMSLFIPKITNINLDPSTKLIYIEEIRDGIEMTIPLYDYGEGSNRLFRILVSLYALKNKILMVDEIDAGIHFSNFRKYIEILLTVANDLNVQIFMTTHNEEWLKTFYQVLVDNENFRINSKIITLERNTISNSIVPIIRSFEDLKFSLSNEFEIRGRQ